MALPEFPRASESFRRANPHIFSQEGGDAPCRDSRSIPISNAATTSDPNSADTKYQRRNEKLLQDQIAAHLQRNGITVIRSRMDKATTNAVGTPDLLFAVKGRAIAFEVKMPGNKPTKEQSEMMRQLALNGWECHVVYSYDQAVEIFQKLSS